MKDKRDLDIGSRKEPARSHAGASARNVAKSESGPEAQKRASPVALPSLIPQDCEQITPDMLTLIHLEQQHIDSIVQTIPAGARNVQDIYPLSSLQEGMLFHRLLLEEKNDTYVLSTLFELQSHEHVLALIDALQKTIERHDVLRTAVLWQGLPRPVQVVYRHARLPVEEISLNRQRDSKAQIDEWMSPTCHTLDLRKAPLVLLQVAADPSRPLWYAILRVHHLLCDHQSLRAVIAEAMSRVAGRAQALPLPVPFRNHLAQILLAQDTADSDAFFRRKLADIYEPTAPFGVYAALGKERHVDEAREALDAALARRIRVQARRYGVSAARLFHAAWGVVAVHTAGRSDIVYGTVLLSGRQRGANAQRVLGMSINTLPLRLQLQGITARELVEQTQRELAELLSHEQASLAVAQSCSGLPASTPLFTSLLNYRHSVPDRESESASAPGVRVLERSEAWTNYPITLTVDDTGEGFELTAQTDHGLDPRRIAAYLRTALQSLLQALEDAPESLAVALPILPPAERSEIIGKFNATGAAYPREKRIHHLFEEQARRTPQQVAVVHGEQSLTYAQLNARANQLARYLQARNVGPGRLAAVCIERRLEMAVALLGILKAGAAYVPLDPNYPAARLQFMLEDATPRLVLTQQGLEGTLPDISAEVIALDAAWPQIAEHGPEDLAEASGPRSEQLVYVIYTSGSTGRPKGTAMTHRSMVNLIEWHRSALPSRPAQRVLQFAALSFDVAFQETFSTLCAGGTLVLLDEWVRKDARALAELLNEQSIERLFVPPLALQSLAEHFVATGVAPRSLRDVITAGEQLRITPEVIVLFQALEGCRLHNHYGPTETHVVTALTLSRDPPQWPTLPSIGRPIANTQLYVLDEQRQIVPIGVAGEIYIGGAGIANGYLNRPELTAQRFMPDAFSPDPQARLYRTGDSARWRADGTLEYLGRNDDQVKIRGYRIELGEIEAQLARHGQVREAAVVAREDVAGQKRLVAYVTLRCSTDPALAEELRAYLKSALPDHMVPSAFVILESMPLTPSGKLNRRALPAPQLNAYPNVKYEPPDGHTEETLAQIWQELVGLQRIGRHDDFFDLGGNSLVAMRVVARIRSAFLIEIPIKLLFEYRTLAALSGQVDALRGARLLDAIADGGAETDELLAAVASMSESGAQDLLRTLRTEAR